MGGAIECKKGGCSCAVITSLAGGSEPLWVSPGRSQVRKCVFQFHDTSASFFCLQNFRGRKVSGPSTKASSCMTPLMNPRAKASTRTQRAQSAPDCGRASCPRMTTGPLMSTTSHGSGTGSPSQLWQVRSQWPCSEAALTHAGHSPLVKGVSALSLPAQISQGLHWVIQLGCPCF